VVAARRHSAALARAMARQFERLGGILRLHDPVLHIHTIGNRAHEVETQSGWRERFDAVASNADIVHSYRDLLGDTVRGPELARKLTRKRFSPALFQVHFALEGTWPGIPHNTLLMGPRFEGLFEDIYEHGVLPADMLIHLHHPTVTDDSLAPPGKSVFRAMIPVANLGKLPIDWEAVGPMIQQRILNEIGRRLIPDIHDRIISVFRHSPRDHALDLNAHLGAAFSLSPVRSQSALLRPPNRDSRLGNFYLVGAGTHPGAGVPAVVASARATARLMLEDMK
jgi:phytoene desaturase